MTEKDISQQEADEAFAEMGFNPLEVEKNPLLFCRRFLMEHWPERCPSHWFKVATA